MEVTSTFSVTPKLPPSITCQASGAAGHASLAGAKSHAAIGYDESHLGWNTQAALIGNAVRSDATEAIVLSKVPTQST